MSKEGSTQTRPASASKTKRKSGNPSGSRNNVISESQSAKTNTQKLDKRLGSKKPIVLVKEKAVKPPETPVRRQFATPAEELAVLEANEKFNHLLDLLEDEAVLSAEDQGWLDKQLERHKILCDLLGIKEEPESQASSFTDSLDAIQIDDFKD